MYDFSFIFIYLLKYLVFEFKKWSIWNGRTDIILEQFYCLKKVQIEYLVPLLTHFLHYSGETLAYSNHDMQMYTTSIYYREYFIVWNDK